MIEALTTNVTDLLREGAEAARAVADVMGQQAPKSAADGVTKGSGTLLRSAGKTVWAKIKSSKARREFTEQWAAASCRKEQEAAVRKLLEADPALQAELAELVQQREYLIAVATACQSLPFLAATYQAASIEDVFVDLPVRIEQGPRGAQAVLPASQFVDRVITETIASTAANHACFGERGSGKTTLCQLMVASYCRRLLLAEDKVVDGALMLPAFVRAADLADGEGAFSVRLKRAIERSLESLLMAPLDDALFEYRGGGRTRRWWVVIDGLDEIADPKQREQLLKAIGRVHLDTGSSFRFFVSCLSHLPISQDALGSDFRIVHLGELSADRVDALYGKYSQMLGRGNTGNVSFGGPSAAWSPALRTPLMIAMAAAVLAGKPHHYIALFELFEEFVKGMLAKHERTAKHSNELLQLLSDLAEREEHAAIDAALIARGEQLGLLKPDAPRFLQAPALSELLMATGLVFVDAGIARFVHASFRSFFRARRFADTREPDALTWPALDPCRNGWDFAQFVLERWLAQGKNTEPVCRNLLFCDREGLQLLSRLAGQRGNFSSDLVAAAISQWRHSLDVEMEMGLIDGAVDNLFLMARSHPVARAEIARIAFGAREYFEDAVQAARYLHVLGQTQEAKAALLKTARRGHSLDRASAGGALCDIGSIEEGVSILVGLLEGWPNPSGAELLASTYALKALHTHAAPQVARKYLDGLTRCELEPQDASFVFETSLEIAGTAFAAQFLETWLAAHPNHQYHSDLLARARRDVRDPKIPARIEFATPSVHASGPFWRI